MSCDQECNRKWRTHGGYPLGARALSEANEQVGDRIVEAAVEHVAANARPEAMSSSEMGA